MATNSRLLCSALENTLHIRDALTGEEVSVHAGHTDPITHLSVSKDARIICTAGEDKMARVWRFDTAKIQGGCVSHIEEEIKSRKPLPPIPDQGAEASAEWNLPMSIIWNLDKLNPIDL